MVTFVGTKVHIEQSDVRSYATKKRTEDGKFVDLEEEKLAVGTHLSAIDFELAAEASGKRTLNFDAFCKLIRRREVGEHTEEELRKRFDLVDADKSGRIEVHEWALFTLRDGLRRSSERVYDMFKQWDEDRSGELSQKEVHRALTSLLGFNLTKEESARLFGLLDTEGSGKLKYAELNRALREGAGSAADDAIAAESAIPGMETTLGGGGPDGAPARKLRRTQSDTGPVRVGRKEAVGEKLQKLGNEQALVLGEGGLDGVLAQLSALMSRKKVQAITLFREMDVDKNGRLDRLEFRAAMGLLGLDAPAPMVDALFKKIDADGEGEIQYAELQQSLTRAADKAPAPSPAAATASATSLEDAPEAEAGKAGTAPWTPGAGGTGRAPPVAPEVGKLRSIGASRSLGGGLLGGLTETVDDDSSPTTAPGTSPIKGEDEGALNGVSVQRLLRRALLKNLARVKDLFVAWDQNGDGRISRNEFALALREVGLKASDRAIDGLFVSFDEDCSGYVDYTELHEALKHKPAVANLLHKSPLQRTLKEGQPEGKMPAELFPVHGPTSGTSNATRVPFASVPVESFVASYRGARNSARSLPALAASVTPPPAAAPAAPAAQVACAAPALPRLPPAKVCVPSPAGQAALAATRPPPSMRRPAMLLSSEDLRQRVALDAEAEDTAWSRPRMPPMPPMPPRARQRLASSQSEGLLRLGDMGQRTRRAAAMDADAQWFFKEMYGK